MKKKRGRKRRRKIIKNKRKQTETLTINMHIEVQVALNFVISYLYNKLPRRRVNIFGEELEKALKDKFQGHWYPEKPFKVRSDFSLGLSPARRTSNQNQVIIWHLRCDSHRINDRVSFVIAFGRNSRATRWQRAQINYKIKLDVLLCGACRRTYTRPSERKAHFNYPNYSKSD